MSSDCLLPASFTSIDPIHPQIGIDILNELVADLHRHEEHIGENRSPILGSTADNISTELINSINGKVALIDTLSQIRSNLLVLIGAEIGDNKWCDEDESPYSGPNTISANLTNHWEWPQVINEIRDVLQNLLCICIVEDVDPPLGQELWFTLIPDIGNAIVFSVDRKIGIDQSTNIAWAKFLADDIDRILSSNFKQFAEIMDVSKHSFTNLSAYQSASTKLFANEDPIRFNWALDATSLEEIDGIGEASISPDPGDIFVEVVRTWVRTFYFFSELENPSKVRDFQINSWPATVSLNGTTIWSKTLSTFGIINPNDILTDELGDYVIGGWGQFLQESGYSNVPTTIDIHSQHNVSIAVNNELSQTSILIGSRKRWSIAYGLSSPFTAKNGIITVKVIRPAR